MKSKDKIKNENRKVEDMGLLLSGDFENNPLGKFLHLEKINFSLESLKEVDKYLDKVRKNKRKLSEEEIKKIILRCGTYLGEVIRMTGLDGLQVGRYTRYGGGFITPTVSTGIELGVAPFQKNLHEFSGSSYDIGGDIGEGGSVGLGASIPQEGKNFDISKFSVGLTTNVDLNAAPVPASVSVTASNTKVKNIEAGLKHLINGIGSFFRRGTR